MDENLDLGISFDLPKNQSNVIKAIGVGGGGSNAINHMYRQGIKGVDFVICNTDAQALNNSGVPNKIQLGVNLTEGLGAGANPEVGEKAALESAEDIMAMLNVNTKMVFITAGMGGGTGTGAAPIIAQMAREMNILTVGIVTTPFSFEGKLRNDQAQAGIEKLRNHVDSLIIINNNKLREVYGNLGFKAGFSKADEVLSTASKGIAEVITHHYTQNIDLKDAKTVLSNSGTAIMGAASSSGTNRANDAITKALDSPLLNDNRITGAKNVLLLIVSGNEEITIDEIKECIEKGEAELVETPLYSTYMRSELSPEEARKNHIRKIAFFALNENTKPISIDVGFPEYSNINGMYFLDDGNHRLAGRIVAGSKTIKAHVMGDVQYLKDLSLWNPNKYQIELDRKYTLQYLEQKEEDYTKLLNVLKEKINKNSKIFNREEFHLFCDILDTYFVHKEEVMDLKEEENIIKKLKY